MPETAARIEQDPVVFGPPADEISLSVLEPVSETIEDLRETKDVLL
jgi:hypothetical protein